MSRFESADQVRRALPSLIRSGVDLERLFRRSGVLGPKLALDHQRTPRPRKLGHAAQTRLRRALADHPIRFVRRTSPANIEPLQTLPGQFDLIVGFRIGLLNETLVSLYDAHTIPHRIDGAALDSLFGPAALQSIVTGVPAGVSLGALHITAAPSIAAIESTNSVLVSLPFELDYVRRRPPVTPGGVGFVSVATSLVATLRFAATVRVESSEGTLRLKFDFDEVPPNAVADVVVAPGSRVQPVTPDALHNHVHGKDAFIRSGVAAQLNQQLADTSIAPPYSISELKGDELIVDKVEVRARAANDGGSLVIGVVLKVKSDPPTVSGDPNLLVHLFDTGALDPGGVNVEVRGQSSLLDKTIRALQLSGKLQEHVDEELATSQPGVHATVLAAGASVGTDGITARLHLEVSGVCLNVLDIVYVVNLRFSVFHGVITFERTDTIEDDGDDEFFCFVNAVPGIILSDLGAVSLHLSGATAVEPAPFFVSGLFQFPTPIPGTESLVAIEVEQAASFSNELASSGTLKLLPDTRNTYVYAQFTDVSALGVRTPIAGAQVTLLDLDNPAPAGDDVRPPVSSTVVDNGIQTKTTVQSFVPSSDEHIADGITDDQGRVRFVVDPGKMVTIIGNQVVTVEKRNLEVPGQTTTTLLPGKLVEPKPDLYFVLRRKDGTIASTQTSPLVNVEQGAHQGHADAPLQFSFGGPSNA